MNCTADLEGPTLGGSKRQIERALRSSLSRPLAIRDRYPTRHLQQTIRLRMIVVVLQQRALPTLLLTGSRDTLHSSNAHVSVYVHALYSVVHIYSSVNRSEDDLYNTSY